LEGKAEIWYSNTTDVDDIPFDEFMVAMFKRFVHSATAGNTCSKYEAVEYKAGDGVQAFYDNLMDTADWLIQQPTESKISRRFMIGLPDRLIDHLHTVKEYTIERTPLYRILQSSVAWEAAQAEYKEFGKIKKGGPATH
jgi:hypothetical protein